MVRISHRELIQLKSNILEFRPYGRLSFLFTTQDKILSRIKSSRIQYDAYTQSIWKTYLLKSLPRKFNFRKIQLVAENIVGTNIFSFSYI